MPPVTEPRIFDCFPFFMELDLLELRLRHLSPLVHCFVLAESAFDFAGNPKPLYFEQNKDRFRDFNDRIVHIIVKDRPPNASKRWAIQRHQRDQLARGLGEARPDDLVMISDVDEIPKLGSIEAMRNALSSRRSFATFAMDHHVYRLNLRNKGRGVVDGKERGIITGTRAVRRRDLKIPHLVRQLKRRYWKSAPDWSDQIPARFNAIAATGLPLPRIHLADAGWHMHSVGGRDLLKAKWDSFIVDEQFQGQTSWDEAFGDALEAGEVADKLGLEHVPLTKLPDEIAQNPDRYAKLLG